MFFKSMSHLFFHFLTTVNFIYSVIETSQLTCVLIPCNVAPDTFSLQIYTDLTNGLENLAKKYGREIFEICGSLLALVEKGR